MSAPNGTASAPALDEGPTLDGQYDAEQVCRGVRPTRLSAQIRLMEERLIIVDNDDNPLGDGSKKECASAHRRGHR